MERYKKIGPIKIKDLWFDTDNFLNSKEKIVCLHTNERLEQQDYDAVFIGQTLLLDISQALDSIYKGFEPKSCRYCIRKSLKDGLIVKQAKTEEEYRKYLDFENKFCMEKGISQVSLEEMVKLDVFYALSSKGEFLGGCAFIVSETEKIARYKYGSTLHKMNANEAILWKAICFYHDAGIQIFDFGGVIPTDDADNYYYRHYHFKKKFGGTLSNSYNYYKMSGIYKVAYEIWNVIVKLFFDGDLNEATNWLNRCGLIK